MSKNLRSLDQLPPKHRAEALRQLAAEDARKLGAGDSIRGYAAEAPILNTGHTEAAAIARPSPRRIRQDTKPLLNKLETEWLNFLRTQTPEWTIHSQALRFRLANGLWYKPDFTASEIRYAWEVKGPHSFRGGFENLKMAAALYREWKWLLVWKDGSQWQTQEILP